MNYSLPLICLLICLRASAASPYIHKIHEYRPAPGQFINQIPEYTPGDDQTSITAKCEQYLVGVKKGTLISLGAYGGYIVFSFDHPLANKPGEYDFMVYGNAFRNGNHTDAGNSEPGILMVSCDANNNGLPDDEWYELAGSEYYKPSTMRHYEITYHKPSATDADNVTIRWTSNDPEQPSGFVARNAFHQQSYWPGWVADSTMHFSGNRLAPNAYQEGGTWLLRSLDWGYADNLPEGEEKGFKLDWAVDADGNHITLTHVDFIKIHTGINQNCDILGETSTEIMGAEDLHPDYNGVNMINADSELIFRGCPDGRLLIDNQGDSTRAAIYDMRGTMVTTMTLNPGYKAYDISTLPTSIYILKAGSNVIKFQR